MNVGRIFAHAVVRRVAYVLVALVLGWLGLTGRAHAQAGACPHPGQGGTCTQAEAWHACQTHIADSIASFNPSHPMANPANHRCVLYQNDKYRYDRYSGGVWNWDEVFYFVSECPAEWFDPETGACEQPTCSTSDSPLNSGFTLALGNGTGACPSTTCNTNLHGDWCRYTGTASYAMTVDGKKYCSTAGFVPTGQPCSLDPQNPDESGEVEPPTDSDGDGISDENDLSPNNPGVGDGTGQEPSRACGGPGQPECLPDGSNEGSGRGNTSSGGGDCNTPPRSSGDAILAQIAFQTWATRCAVTAAANQIPGTGSGGGDGGDGDGSEMDKLRNEAAGLDTSLGEGDADAAWIEAPSGLDLDTGGLGIGGTCPAPPTINGVSIDPDNNLCMLVQIIGSLVLVGAFAHAGYIIGRA